MTETVSNMMLFLLFFYSLFFVHVVKKWLEGQVGSLSQSLIPCLPAVASSYDAIFKVPLVGRGCGSLQGWP